MDPIPPPDKPKTALKVGKFFPVFSNSTPPWHNNDVDNGEDEDGYKPGIYSKIIDGTGDDTHYITASFVKTMTRSRTSSCLTLNISWSSCVQI
jgi:hypothetical protein